MAKLKDGFCQCFLNLGSLFYSKEETEVQIKAHDEINKMRVELESQMALTKQVQDKYNQSEIASANEIQKLQNKI